ncbi:hypothetical protein [Sphingomonas oryzagri]|uniref:Uncharacterized protein n=1 Tax=Sphingomonas oryzagri TaxID=3042314 RepID=A0ABT6N0U8_9SPHN|nr:hypothetical protein [Sphingomonas oryzagri]MDH7638925.1 hypothetical protein [Sphingomonas oryzagri]
MRLTDHSFVESTPCRAMDIDYDALMADEVALSRRSHAWDQMAEAALDFETDAYEQARARFWAMGRRA